MAKINPYLHFNGNAEEAFTFYTDRGVIIIKKPNRNGSSIMDAVLELFALYKKLVGYGNTLNA